MCVTEEWSQPAGTNHVVVVLIALLQQDLCHKHGVDGCRATCIVQRYLATVVYLYNANSNIKDAVKHSHTQSNTAACGHT